MNRVIRKFSCISCAILGVAATGLIISSSSSALTEESEVDVKFTFNPMLTLSVSSADIIIPNLIPGTSDNSNTVAVTVNTNNISGYSLSATVGNTTNSSRNLVHTALNTNLFSSIDTSSNITSFTTDNTWGYSIDDGAHYSGLPIYTDTPKEIKKTTEAGNSYTNFLIGAKASSTQISGDYTNVINFTVVGNPLPSPYMQNLEPSLCATESPLAVVDSRDNEEYLVQRLADGNCWMLDNLRLDLTEATIIDGLDPSNTNATSEDLGHLKNGGGTTSDKWPTAGLSRSNWVSSYSYSVPLIATKNASDTEGVGWNPNTVVSSYGLGSGKIGVYYNYCAASSGSYCWGDGQDYYGAPSSDPVPNSGYDITSDICPAGWRMPTGGAINTSVTPNQGEYQSLYESYSSDKTSFKEALSTPLSGQYRNGEASAQNNSGGFWSATMQGPNTMLQLNVSADFVTPQNGINRNYGYSVRCIMK